jgi:hypothetical protein
MARWHAVCLFYATITYGLTLTMAFQLVCVECDSVGVIIDGSELAPPSTIVKCSHCRAARGTLGDLRDLAHSGQRDPFESSSAVNA